MGQLENILGRVEGLPTLPAVVSRMNQLIDNPATSAGDINDLISRDLALTARILKVVNSAFYGFPRRISSMTHAVVILGFNTVRDIALSTFVFEAFDTRGLPFGHRNFWVHSLGTAVAANTLAVRLGRHPADDAFVAGLLHDVGKVIMFQYLRPDFIRVLERAERDGVPFVEAERTEIETGHAEIGGLLMENWKLPEHLVNALRYHHRPEIVNEQHQQIAAIVHLGDIFARAMLVGSGGDASIPAASESAWQLLGLAENDLPELFSEFTAEMNKAGAFLEMIPKS